MGICFSRMPHLPIPVFDAPSGTAQPPGRPVEAPSGTMPPQTCVDNGTNSVRGPTANQADLRAQQLRAQLAEINPSAAQFSALVQRATDLPAPPPDHVFAKQFFDVYHAVNFLTDKLKPVPLVALINSIQSWPDSHTKSVAIILVADMFDNVIRQFPSPELREAILSLPLKPARARRKG
jgi:hypothetical protein